jgi:quinol monooxygenase YgiN
MAIGALVTLTAKVGNEAELLERVTDVVADGRAEPGCLFSVVLRRPEEPQNVQIFQIYTDQAAIDAHNVAPHTVEKRPGIFALLEEARQSTRYETIDWPAGLKVTF